MDGCCAHGSVADVGCSAKTHFTMMQRTMGPATRRHTATRRRATAFKICLSYLVLVLVPLLDSAVNEAAAWKDQGHMLVAAIARQFMNPTTLARVEGVLEMWKKEYPTTSTLESASVWLDHVGCKQPGDYCNFARQDGIQLFKTWHYCSVPWNPQDIPLRLIDRVLPLPIGGADWALQVIYTSLRGCTGDDGGPNPSGKRAAGGKQRRRRRYRRRRPRDRFRLRTAALAEAQVDRHREQPCGHGPAAESRYRLRRHFSRTREGGVPERSSGFSPYPAVVPAEMCAHGAAEEAGRGGPSRSYPAAEAAGSQMCHTSGMPTTGGGVCSVLSYSLYLRILIHVFADIHQPLHASEVFSKVFPRGDFGGNRIYVIPPDAGCTAGLRTADPCVEGSASTTLHGEWDSVFGQYPKFFHHIDMQELRAEARRLAQKYPVVEKARRTFSDFVTIIRESHQFVRDFVYSEFNWNTFSYDFLPYKPSEAYVAGARRVGEERLTLAGVRLAFLLDSIAEFLPRRPLNPVPGVQGACNVSLPRNLEDNAANEALLLSGAGAKGAGPIVLGAQQVGLGLKDTVYSAGNTGGGDSSDGDKKGEVSLSSKEAGSTREEQGTGMASVALAGTISPAVATCVVLLLMVTLLVALWFAWTRIGLYKRALQVVLRSGAQTEACRRAAAAAEVGDWKTAAAVLREYDDKGRPPYAEGAGAVSTVNDGAPRFSGVFTRRLLTT